MFKHQHMRKITVDGNEYKWIVGKRFIKIQCAEIGFSLIIPEEKSGHAVTKPCSWCGDSRCTHGEKGYAITPVDIRKKILEQKALLNT